MTLTADRPADTSLEVSTAAPVLSASDLVQRVRAEREVRDAADARILVHAVAWAELHTIDPAAPVDTPGLGQQIPGIDRPEDLEWVGLPTLRWDTAASFAAALGLTTTAGRSLIRDALTLAVRMPRVWTRVGNGTVQAWRARRIAQTVQGQPDDVATLVDQLAAPRAQEIGPVVLDRLLDEALLRLHAEERELDHLEALDARYATLHLESIGHTGICDFTARGDIAAALQTPGVHGCGESLDVRRSLALGILADPHRAAALLDARGNPDDMSADDEPALTRRRGLVATLHLTEANLLGLDPLATDHQHRALLDQAVRAWAARNDMTLHITPVRHCGGCSRCTHDAHAEDPRLCHYEPTPTDRTVVTHRDPTCVFPWCSRPSTGCDLDHTDPFDEAQPARGGPTCHHNLAPLCRHHHRLKTLAGWTYETLDPGTYLWHDRYAQTFLRTPTGTTDIT